MTKFLTFLISLIVIGLFSFSLISWGSNIQRANSVNDSFMSNTLINSTYGSLQGNLSDMDSISQTQRQSFETDESVLGMGDLLFGSIRDAGKVFGSSVVVFFNIIGALPTILGIPPIVLGTISAIVVIILIFTFWRVLKVGE